MAVDPLLKALPLGLEIPLRWREGLERREYFLRSKCLESGKICTDTYGKPFMIGAAGVAERRDRWLRRGFGVESASESHQAL
jgi:hypothetical protein